MLSRISRLAKKKDIELVYKRGRVLANRFFRIKYLANRLGGSRATVIVSKKVSPLATQRNRIKRQLRPLLKRSIQESKQKLDVMLIVQPSIKKLSSKEIKEQGTLVLNRLFKNHA